MNRPTRSLAAAALVVLMTAPLPAATIFWQGGSGTLISPNYSDGTNTNLTPGTADIVNFGNGGSATHSAAGTTNLSKLRVGHILGKRKRHR